MDGDMALMVTVVSYGNEYLRGGPQMLDYRHHTSFSHCSRVIFRDFTAEDTPIISRDVNGWFEYLKQNGCKMIRLDYTPQNRERYSSLLLPQTACWIVETIYEAYSDYWNCVYRFSEFRRMLTRQPIIDQQANLGLIQNRLYECLDTLYTFAMMNASARDARFFGMNKEILYSREPVFSDFHTDLVVSGNYGLLARQLLTAAVSSWCFSGMGSWSDNYLFPREANERKDELTQRLYFAVCDAIMYSVNSF